MRSSRITAAFIYGRYRTCVTSRGVARCRGSRLRRLRVVEALRQAATLGDTVEIIDALVAMGLRDLRIACVDVHEDPSLLAQTEFLASRAGLAGRVFGDVDGAETWLLADVAPRSAD